VTRVSVDVDRRGVPSRGSATLSGPPSTER
jgi:hypothetical protein